jgi:hypothetical protein
LVSRRTIFRARFPRALAFTAFAIAVLTTVPASAATRQVSRSGTNSGNCLSAPCASLSYAYGQAASGDVVNVAPGTYPPQSTPNGSKSVAFKGGSGVVLRQMINDASNVTFDGISVDAGGVQTTNAAFELGGNNVTVKNASVGNVADEKGMLASGDNLTIDNVTFHDVVLKTDGVHLECLYAIGVQGLTVRNSTFRDCSVFDIFFTYGSWWSPLPPAYGGVTLENNVFGHTEMENNGGWHYYTVYVGDTGPHGTGGDPLNHWLVRNNTFELPMFISSSGGSNGTRFVNNLGSWDCMSGVTYSNNVGSRCSASDKAVSPASSTSSRTAAFGWEDPRGGDFRLTSGSPAVNAGNPNDAPTLDRLGLLRDNRPDAGAYEFGAKGPGTGSGGSSSSLAIGFARLKPKTICRHARKSCPNATKLRVRVSMGSRIAVQLKRVRKGHKPKRAKAFTFVLEKSRSHRIRARKLRQGRYVVVLVAKRPGGMRSEARRLKLRVR